jgi:predicted O-methyltransferase YrrM
MPKTLKKLLAKLSPNRQQPRVSQSAIANSDFGAYPPGHYYSPIPNKAEILEQIDNSQKKEVELLDINLNREEQLQNLEVFQTFYPDLPFIEEQNSELRYYFSQNWFCYADAIFLYSFLRQTKPKRIIEVGSGFSSAVILDTVEKFFTHRPEITFIEPYPDRLKSLLKPEDLKNCKILESSVQKVPLDCFTSLEAGDLLFIDSSHVVKYGSDLQFLLFEILPRSPVGIFVHFHDIFYPFEYPIDWIKQGRYWNEGYFIRAFLAYNQDWKIHFFNTYVVKTFETFIAKNMPLCLKNPGGSLYLKRVNKS